MHGRKSRTRLGAALGLLVLGATACADDKPLNIFEPRGPQAEEIDNLMNPIWPIMGIVFILVIGGTIWIATAPASAEVHRLARQ